MKESGEYFALKRIKMDNEKEGVSSISLIIIVPDNCYERNKASAKTKASEHSKAIRDHYFKA